MKNFSSNMTFKGKGLIIFTVASVCCIAGFGMKIASSKNEQIALQESISKKEKSISLFKTTQIAQKSLGEDKGTTRVAAVARFTSELEVLSQFHGVGLSQLLVEAVTRPAPGVSPANPTWIESDVSFTIGGSAPKVYSYLAGLNSVTTKFRILDVNLSPLKSNSDESTNGVTAVVRLSLLMKSGATS